MDDPAPTLEPPRMRRTFCSFITLSLPVCIALLLSWSNPAQGLDSEKSNDNAPDSPTPAAPKWLRFVDQGSNDKRLAGYRTPEGIKLEIVAEAPVVVNPVALAFADDGTPHVVEWVPSPGDERRQAAVTFSYRNGSSRKVLLPAKRKKDIVKVLSLARGKTAYDRATIVLEEELPSSILLHDGWLYLSGRGTVRRYKQSRVGGVYDRKEMVAQGFGGLGRRQVSGLTIGPDGWLYITAGAADNVVEGSDGSRATVLRSGAIFRCRPDGSKVDTHATGFLEPYQNVMFDLAGNLFHTDIGKLKSCRLLHVVEGADFGWRLSPAGRTVEQPGRMPEHFKIASGAPAGLFVYNDTRLPEQFRGLLFYPDLNSRVIRAFKVEPVGASFQVTEQFEFLLAPKDELFRPSQMVLGPDGAIYVVDWRSKPTDTDRLWGDGKHGRIYRISWSGTRDEPALALRGTDSWAKVTAKTDGELIEALSSEEASDREKARQELVRRGDRNRSALLRALKADKTTLGARIAAVGVLQSMYDDEVEKAFLMMLKAGDESLRRLVVEALGRLAKKGDQTVQDALLKAFSDEDRALRRAVPLAMGRVAGAGAADSLATALSFDDGKDLFLREGIIRGLDLLGKPGIKALLTLADSGVQKDTDRVVETFLTLRSRAAFEALPALLNHRHVESGQRAQLIRSTANYLLDPPVSLEAIVALVAKEKEETEEVKKALLDVLATPGLDKGAKADDWVVSMLDDTSDEVRRRSIRVLGTTAPGARLVGKRFIEKKLPRSLLPEVTAALRKHADKDAQAKKLLAEVQKR
jgi:putative membrane-bound dehydrogenase-like protein